MVNKKIQKLLTALLIIFVAGLVVLGVYARLYSFGSMPSGFYWDEVAIFLDAKSIAETGKDIHGNSWLQTLYASYGDYKLPVYIWFVAGLIQVFGDHLWLVRLPSLLAGFGTIGITGVLAYVLLEKNRSELKFTGYIAMAVATTTPWLIHFSRVGFEGHLGQFLLATAMLLVVLSGKRNRILFLMLGSLLALLATYTYYSIRFVWPVITLVWFTIEIATHLTKTQSISWQIIRKGVIGLLLSLSIWFGGLYFMQNSPQYAASQRFRLSTPSVLNTEYQHEANAYRAMSGNSFIDRAIFHRWWLLTLDLGKNTANQLNPNFWFSTGDPNLRHGTSHHGLVLFVSFVPLIAGFLYLAKKNFQVLLFLSSWFAIGILPAVVPFGVPHALRSLNVAVPIVVLLSSGWSYLYEISKENIWKKIFLFGLLVVASFQMLGYLTWYFGPYQKNSAKAWQAGYLEMAGSSWQVADKYSKVIIMPSDDRFYLWLLVTSPLSTHEIQALETSNYRFTEIGNITISPGTQKVKDCQQNTSCEVFTEKDGKLDLQKSSQVKTTTLNQVVMVEDNT